MEIFRAKSVGDIDHSNWFSVLFVATVKEENKVFALRLLNNQSKHLKKQLNQW